MIDVTSKVVQKVGEAVIEVRGKMGNLENTQDIIAHAAQLIALTNAYATLYRIQDAGGVIFVPKDKLADLGL